MDKRKRRLLCMLEGSGRKSRWISGAPPLSFKAQAAGTLENYRIYGNTVNGESVGDRTGNLFDEIYTNISDDSSVTVIYKYYYVGDGTFTLSSNIARYEPLCNLFLLSGKVTSGASSVYNGVWAEQSRTVQSINGYITIGYRNYFDIDPRNYHTMLNSGSEPLPYEPYGYNVPVTISNDTDTLTTPIYLPEQIKKVGDEAEYIDYGEQKQHRVRKNLLQNTATSQTIKGVTFTVNADGSITCSGILTSGEYADLVISGVFFGDTDILENGNYVVSCANGSNNASLIVGNRKGEVGRVRAAEINISANLTWAMLRIRQADPAITLYPMIRKADISDDTYEPYIENTDLDVTLPALPTLTGTNVLSVGTAVQPSKIEVKGKIKDL